METEEQTKAALPTGVAAAFDACTLPHAPCPRMARIQQFLPTQHIPDVRTEVRERLLAAGLRNRIQAGHRIAITAGSRGIGGFIALLNGMADAVRACGGEPFLVPAMGSHGGATPEGQTEILRRLGVTEQNVDAPIQATMDTVALGKADNGAEAHMDAFAAHADGVLVLGRVKTHPELIGDLASGLLKMMTIGLGKQKGAQAAHTHGLWESVKAVPHLQFATQKILFGVAVVENGYREPVIIDVVPPDYEAVYACDRQLLDVAKAYLPTLPFAQLDLLIVDEIGKSVSGAGMDPNVIGRWHLDTGSRIPDITRIVALSLTPASLGNGLGIGLADFTTCRFLDSFNPYNTLMNLLTATEPDNNTREGKMPPAFTSDKDAIEIALYSALAQQDARVCRIKNTGDIAEMWISESLLAEVDANPKLRVLSGPEPPSFDAHGNLF